MLFDFWSSEVFGKIYPDGVWIGYFDLKDESKVLRMFFNFSLMNSNLSMNSQGKAIEIFTQILPSFLLYRSCWSISVCCWRWRLLYRLLIFWLSLAEFWKSCRDGNLSLLLRLIWFNVEVEIEINYKIDEDVPELVAESDFNFNDSFIFLYFATFSALFDSVLAMIDEVIILLINFDITSMRDDVHGIFRLSCTKLKISLYFI